MTMIVMTHRPRLLSFGEFQEKFSGAVTETGGSFQQGYIIMPATAGGSSWNEPN